MTKQQNKKVKTPNPNKLSLDEEIQLIILAKNNPEFKNKVFEKYRYLILNVGKIYFNSDLVDSQDLIQEGYLGLDRAIQEFNPSRRKRFSSSAAHWVKCFLADYYRNNSRPFSIAHTVTDKLNEMRKFSDNFESVNHREPSLKEIGRAVGYPEAKINYLNRYKQMGHVCLDAGRNEKDANDNFTKETIGGAILDGHSDNPGERELRTDGVSRIKSLISQLEIEEQYVLNKRYCLDGDCEKVLTYREIAAQMSQFFGRKINCAQIKSIQKLAEDKLKNRLD